MGVFDDKKFEELDWISQATEPIDSQMNEILGKLPEIIEVDFPMYKKIVGEAYGLEISINKMISFAVQKFAPGCPITYQQINALEKCFKFEFSGEELILDYEKEAISGGEITFVKLNSTMDEKVLESLLGNEGIESLYHLNLSAPENMSRANEVMELLAHCEDGLRTRSSSKKQRAISKRLKTLFKNNEWKIKDTELANKVGFWIRDYISDGNLAAFSNFCRLKVMTHKDQPIYSMEEIK